MELPPALHGPSARKAALSVPLHGVVIGCETEHRANPTVQDPENSLFQADYTERSTLSEVRLTQTDSRLEIFVGVPHAIGAGSREPAPTKCRRLWPGGYDGGERKVEVLNPFAEVAE